MSTITKERIELFIKSPLENGLNGIEQATHWMPLPEPPQEVNRG